MSNQQEDNTENDLSGERINRRLELDSEDVSITKRPEGVYKSDEEFEADIKNGFPVLRAFLKEKRSRKDNE